MEQQGQKFDNTEIISNNVLRFTPSPKIDLPQTTYTGTQGRFQNRRAEPPYAWFAPSEKIFKILTFLVDFLVGTNVRFSNFQIFLTDNNSYLYRWAFVGDSSVLSQYLQMKMNRLQNASTLPCKRQNFKKFKTYTISFFWSNDAIFFTSQRPPVKNWTSLLYKHQSQTLHKWPV